MGIHEEDIVVVIGAGASSNYRMPTNKQLKDFLIKPSLYLHSQHVRDMPHGHFGAPFEALDNLSTKLFAKILNSFKNDSIDNELINILIKSSSEDSIDQIWYRLNMANKHEHAKLLKVKAISSITLFMLARKTYHNHSWLKELSNKIGLEAILKMKWIIFNYDLFFEEDLAELFHEKENSLYRNKSKSLQIRGLTRLTNPLALDISGAAPIVETFRPMGWVDPQIYDYENNFHTLIHNVNNEYKIEAEDFLNKIIENTNYCIFMEEPLSISTLPNRRDRDDIQNIIKSCKKIIFLGYGFNKKNNELLSDTFENDVLPKAFGTSFKIDKQKIKHFRASGAHFLDRDVISFIKDWQRNITK